MILPAVRSLFELDTYAKFSSFKNEKKLDKKMVNFVDLQKED